MFVVASLAQGPHVFDLDTTLGFPVPLDRYLDRSFPGEGSWPTAYRPQFRPGSAVDVMATFASDRRHMKEVDGQWRAPPPSWPILQGAAAPHDLDRWLDVDDPGRGPVYSLPEFGSVLAVLSSDGVDPHLPIRLEELGRRSARSAVPSDQVGV